jgi:hypothetical protein
MPRSFIEQFLDRFALPLLRGAEVTIGRPLGLRGVQRLLAPRTATSPPGGALDTLLSACQTRLLAMGVPPPGSVDFAGDEAALTLLAGMHDLLFLARPEALQLRPALRGAILREIIAATAPLPSERFAPASELSSLESGVTGDRLDAEILLRHALLEPLFRLQRRDIRRKTWLSETLERGVERARQPPGGDGLSLDTLCWLELPLVVDGGGTEALGALLAASPLTALWQLRAAPALPTEASPMELRRHAPLLRRRYLCRIVCRRFLDLGLPRVAEALSAPLLGLLRQAVTDPDARRDARTWLGLVSHLHWLSFILFADSAGFTAAIPEGETPFFALFSSLWTAFPELALPADVAADAALAERARAHAERCRAAVPALLLQHLQQLLTRALASPSQ